MKSGEGSELGGGEWSGVGYLSRASSDEQTLDRQPGESFERGHF